MYLKFSIVDMERSWMIDVIRTGDALCRGKRMGRCVCM